MSELNTNNANENNKNIRIVDMTLIISTVLCLLPVVFGIFMWKELPDMIPTHFGMDGNPDTYSSKTFAVFFTPLLSAAMNLMCHIIWNSQLKSGKQKKEKLITVVKWLIPAVSLISSFVTYTAALGKGINVIMIVGLLVGVTFILIGNYLPKTTQGNSLRYGLNFEDSDEIFEKTKRPQGFILVILGLIVAGFSFTKFEPYVILISVAVYLISFFVLMGIARKNMDK